MADSIAITALRLQGKSCEISNGQDLRFSHNGEMDAAWIRAQLTKTGKSQAGLARALDINPSGINRLLAGDRQLKASEIDRVKAYFASNRSNLPQKWNLHGEVPGPKDGPDDMLRVLGMAEGGPDGWNLWNGEVIQHIRRPDNLVGVPGAYAVYVTGSSMEPRFNVGELLHIHPGKPVTPGCYVLVQRQPRADGEPPMAVIKRLVRRSGSKIVLEQHSPSKTFEIKAEEIISMHRVVGSSEA